ncbi:MAG: TIGR01777 family protein [Cytophagales bacterium]|nr:TIGR01777 family protein [Cytophagales bacterium]
MPSKILITGGTGMVGSRLTQRLIEKKDKVSILTTSAVRAEETGAFYWNLKDQYIDYRAFEDVDYIIHLAGAGVADERWTKERKKIIYDSRVANTRLLFERSKGYGIKGIIAASAVGYYGMDAGDQWVDEKTSHGNDFLSDVVVDWERAIDSFGEIMEQVVKLRIGVVLDPVGGALPKISKPIRLGVGSPLGNGQQWLSWIHSEDLAKMILFALDSNLSGTYNAVAPNPITNADFTKAVAKELNRSLWLPNAPAFILKMVFGELAQVVLGGNRVKSNKIKKKGFSFDYPQLDAALMELLE